MGYFIRKPPGCARRKICRVLLVKSERYVDRVGEYSSIASFLSKFGLRVIMIQFPEN